MLNIQNCSPKYDGKTSVVKIIMSVVGVRTIGSWVLRPELLSLFPAKACAI